MKYESDYKTKDEFKKLLKWVKKNGFKEDLDETVEEYLKDSDIAVTNISVLHGANTRSASRELAYLVAGVIGVFILVTILFYKFG